jgi:hypothetical protein
MTLTELAGLVSHYGGQSFRIMEVPLVGHAMPSLKARPATANMSSLVLHDQRGCRGEGDNGGPADRERRLTVEWTTGLGPAAA